MAPLDPPVSRSLPRYCTKKSIGPQASLYRQLFFIAFLEFLEVSSGREELRAGKCHKQECA